MDLTALLAAGRAAHEELMVDTVRLQRPGTDVYNAATGATTQPDARVLYEGPGRVKPTADSSQQATEVGERAVATRRYEVALPWSTVPLAADRVVPGDQVLVVTSPDPRLAGRVLWVEAVQESATATAWRITAEDRS
jgi:hypothetical protein